MSIEPPHLSDASSPSPDAHLRNLLGSLRIGMVNIPLDYAPASHASPTPLVTPESTVLSRSTRQRE